MTELDCAAVADELPELALGVLGGRERAAVIAHVDSCPPCRQELARMSEVVDCLVELTPAAEPPTGFESRVLAALRPDPDSGAGDEADAPVPLGAARRRTSPAGRRPFAGVRRGPALAAAAVVVALGCVAGGWAVGQVAGGGPSPSGARQVVAAALRSGTGDLGEVIATRGSRPWIAMAVDSNLGNASVECQVQGANGARIDAGWFTLSGGDGYWSAPVPPAAWPLRAARVLDSAGHTVATATFSS